MDTLFVGLRVVVSLGAVLALLWVIQRKVSKSGAVAKKAKHISVVARQGVAGKASVAVVDVDGARYVLGVTEQSVNVLSVGEVPQEARVTPLAPVAPAATPIAPTPVAAASFAAALAAEDSARATGMRPAASPTGADSTHAASPRRAARAAAAAAPVPSSPVAGSILSAATWKQAAAAMRQQRRA